MSHRIGSFAAVLLLVAALPAFGQESDAFTVMMSSGDGLRAQGMDYQLQQIDFFGREGAYASAQNWKQGFRWVVGDERRNARGVGLTYLIDERAAAAGDLSVAAVSSAVDRAADTWSRDNCSKGMGLERAGWDGTDATVFDFLLEVGEFGDPFQADVVVAGFTPEMAGVFSDDIIAFAVTFVFVDGTGTPTDVDQDGNLDTALSEIYLNPDVGWSIGGGEGDIDVETTVLHELGHSLGIGHLGAPPAGVMNPVYAGVRQELAKIDHAALCMVTSRE